MLTDVLVVWLPVASDDFLAAVPLNVVPNVGGGQFSNFTREHSGVGYFFLVFPFIPPLRNPLVPTFSPWLVRVWFGSLVGFQVFL